MRIVTPVLLTVLLSTSVYAQTPTTSPTQGTQMSYKTQPLCIGFVQMDIPSDMQPFNPENYTAYYNYHYFKNQENISPAQFDKQTNELAAVFKNRVFTSEERNYNHKEAQSKFEYPNNSVFKNWIDLGMQNALYQYTGYSPNKRVIIGTEHISQGNPSSATYFTLNSQLFLYSPAAKRAVNTLQLEFESYLAPQRKEQIRPFVESLEVFDGHPKPDQTCVGPVTVSKPDRYPSITYGMSSADIQGRLTVKYGEPYDVSDQAIRRKFAGLESKGGARFKLVSERSRILDGMAGQELCYFAPKDPDPDYTNPGNRDRYGCYWWYRGVENDFKKGSLLLSLDIYKVVTDGTERSEADVMAIWNQLLDSVKYRDGVLIAHQQKIQSGQVKVGDPCPQTGFWACEQLSGDQGIFLRKGDLMPGQSFKQEEQANMQWRLVKPKA